MKVIIRDSEGVTRTINYPGLDISEPPRRTELIEGEKVVVEGWPEGEKAYVEVVGEKPSYDPRTHKLNKTHTWTETPYNGHAHILIYEIGWELEQLSNESIIANLDEELGTYLDTTCPVWKRGKYNTEAIFLLRKIALATITALELERVAYLESVQAWFEACRAERQSQEDALVNDGTLPDFDSFKLTFPS